MFMKQQNGAGRAVLVIAAAMGAMGWGGRAALAQHNPSARGSAAAEAVAQGPHGGELATANPLSFEVVYLPQEIRVYVYGRVPQPVASEDVTGEVVLQRPHDERQTRLALRYITPPAGQQGYLSAPVDLSRVKDGDFAATIKLANLPRENRPGTSFTQPVVLSKGKPQVTLATVDETDQAGIARQRVCPVTGEPLDSMGGPVKVLVGGQPVYLCCKGCLGKVKTDPEGILRKVNQGQ